MFKYDSDIGRFKPTEDFALEILDEPEKIIPSYFEVLDLAHFYDSGECYDKYRKVKLMQIDSKLGFYRRDFKKTREYEKKQRREYEKKRRAECNIQYRAKGFIYRAIKRGKIVRPSSCSQCGGNGRINGHHSDYSKPAEVIWLCQKCHKKIHAESPWLTELV